MLAPLRSTTLSLAFTVLLACGMTDLDRDTDAPIQTADLEYTLRQTASGLEAEIPYEYTRTGPGPRSV